MMFSELDYHAMVFKVKSGTAMYKLSYATCMLKQGHTKCIDHTFNSESWFMILHMCEMMTTPDTFTDLSKYVETIVTL